jgi:AraC-like DNA-binding protein
MQALAILFCGFSIFSAFSISLMHFRREVYRQQPEARIMGLVLLGTLAGLQLAHFGYLEYQSDWVHGPVYHALLFLVAPAFYLFSKPLLLGKRDTSRLQWLHLSPVVIGGFLPEGLAMAGAFGIGAIYLIWLGLKLYALRAERTRFQMEIALLSMMIVIGIIVMLLGLGAPLITENFFFTLYSLCIGAVFLLMNLTLGYAPQLPADIVEAAEATYAVSTLENIDSRDALNRLIQLMEDQQLYRQPDLNLTMLAEKLHLTRHQLSELINTQIGKGLSRFIREYRVEAAKQMLIEEPDASVLSIGLSAGFTSQSTFYQAFNEIVGMSPGQFRQLRKL